MCLIYSIPLQIVLHQKGNKFMRDLKDTVAWITGAGTGIGEGAAVAMASHQHTGPRAPPAPPSTRIATPLRRRGRGGVEQMNN